MKSKIRNYELIALIVMGGGIPSATYAAAHDTLVVEKSVMIECKEKFDEFFELFSSTFKDSFSEESTEMFDVTATKLVTMQNKLEHEVLPWLQDRAQQIAHTHGKHSPEYLYIEELIAVSKEFFKKRLVPLVTTFKKHYKDNITKFVGILKKSIDPIVEQSNFASLKKHVDTLRNFCQKAGHSDIAQGYDLLWKKACEARDEYLHSANPEILLKWRRRTPK